MSLLSLYDIKNILHPTINTTPGDDFRIIDSWAEYEDASSPSERPLKYLCYELEAIDPVTEEVYRFYKALKFVRVARIPKSVKQSEALMDMHAQVLSALYSSNCNFVTVIGNVLKPVALGAFILIWGTRCFQKLKSSKGNRAQ